MTLMCGVLRHHDLSTTPHLGPKRRHGRGRRHHPGHVPHRPEALQRRRAGAVHRAETPAETLAGSTREKVAHHPGVVRPGKRRLIPGGEAPKQKVATTARRRATMGRSRRRSRPTDGTRSWSRHSSETLSRQHPTCTGTTLQATPKPSGCWRKPWSCRCSSQITLRASDGRGRVC